MNEYFEKHKRVYQTGGDRNTADYLLVHNLSFYTPKTVYEKLYRIGAIIVFTILPVLRWCVEWFLTLN